MLGLFASRIQTSGGDPMPERPISTRYMPGATNVCMNHPADLFDPSTHPAPRAVAQNGSERLQLSLLGGFSLQIDGDFVLLPRHARRGLAFLFLDKIAERDCDRCVLAERLWTDAPVQRARGSLRSALWRIRQASPA